MCDATAGGMLWLAAAHRPGLTAQPNTTPAATALFRDREGDIALGMAQRLGKKVVIAVAVLNNVQHDGFGDKCSWLSTLAMAGNGWD